MVMAQTSQPRHIVRFGTFEIDLDEREVLKHGVRIKLHEKPFKVLLALLEQPGQIVTRKALQERLWPGDTFVEFENGLNNAISRLRETLGDTAESPRFIETVPRRGYRFVAPLETDAGRAPEPTLRARRRKLWLMAAGLVIVALGAIGYKLLAPQPRALDSLVVLPLVAMNVAEGSEDEYLAFGMTEALTAELSKIRALKVISQTSAMQYKGAKKSLPQIAQELGVKAVVEGSVVREGNQLRITVQLIEAASDTHLWAETYTREMSNVLTLQTEIARAIAREIHITLTPQEASALGKPAHVADPRAHEAYLRGRYFWKKQTEDSTRKALEYLQQATTLDPQYAAAFAGLSDVYWDVAAGFDRNPVRQMQAREKARQAAEQALALDPALSDAHVSAGFVKLHFDWDWAGAESSFRRALELNPNDVLAHGGLAEYSLAMGKAEEALAHFQKAYELAPASVMQTRAVGNGLFYARRYDQAIQQLQRTLEMDRNVFTVADLERARLQTAARHEAIAALQEAVGESGDRAELWALLGYAHVVNGNRAEARRILDSLLARPDAPALFVAPIYAGLGENAKAIGLLARAVEKRESGVMFFRIWPEFDSLRDDPRYVALLKNMNLPQ